MSNQIKREHLFELIKGGVSPSHFLVNTTYDNINQKRNIEFINLKNILENKTNFSEDKIVAFGNEAKNQLIKGLYNSVRATKVLLLRNCRIVRINFSVV